MKHLIVRFDAVAQLRRAGPIAEPDLVVAATLFSLAGAFRISVHLCLDRRDSVGLGVPFLRHVFRKGFLRRC